MLIILLHGLVDVPYFKNDLSALFWIILSLLALLSYEKININKLISQRSNYSRRQAENLVRQGLVSTKERIIQLGEEFNPQEEIFVKGKTSN